MTTTKQRAAKDEQRWTDAWNRAYSWRADHWGKMPEKKHRRMMYASMRSEIAWRRERAAVEFMEHLK